MVASTSSPGGGVEDEDDAAVFEAGEHGAAEDHAFDAEANGIADEGRGGWCGVTVSTGHGLRVAGGGLMP